MPKSEIDQNASSSQTLETLREIVTKELKKGYLNFALLDMVPLERLQSLIISIANQFLIRRVICTYFRPESQHQRLLKALIDEKVFTQISLGDEKLNALNKNQVKKDNKIKKEILFCFNQPGSIHTLKLNDLNLGFGDACIIAEFLIYNNSLTTLSLAENVFGTSGIRPILKALTPSQDAKSNNTLTTLNLDCANDELVRVGELEKEIVSFLKHNTTLTSLSLMENGLTDSSFSEIFNAIQSSNTVLTHLNLSKNYLQNKEIEGDYVFQNILMLLSQCKSLRHIQLKKTNFETHPDSLNLLCKTIDINSSITALDIFPKEPDIQKVLMRNKQIETELQSYFGYRYIYFAFINSNEKHPFKESIIPLIPDILAFSNLKFTYHKTKDKAKLTYDPTCAATTLLEQTKSWKRGNIKEIDISEQKLPMLGSTTQSKSCIIL